MTAASAPVLTRPERTTGRPLVATARLLRLELRHNAMLWMLPVAIGVFWFVSYRKIMNTPPLWYPRATSLQSGVVADFIVPVVGAATWMGSRDVRRRLTDQIGITARPRSARLLVMWAATTIWALAGYGACLALVYGVTAREASWGGPLWWPAVVTSASVAAFSALGFAVGTLLPGRLTAPFAAVISWFVLVLSTEFIQGSHSAWQISPVVAAPWDVGPDVGQGTFYPFVPDMSIVQLLFLVGLAVSMLGALVATDSGRRARWVGAAAIAAGVVAAAAGVALAGTGTLDRHGMIAVPALHDAASDRPISFTAVCSHSAIPVCVNPAYSGDLPAVAGALNPLFQQIAGLPGVPVQISQAAVTYQQGPDNSFSTELTGGRLINGNYRVLFPDQLGGPPMTTSQLAEQVRGAIGPAVIASFVGDGPGTSGAQQAVATALSIDAGLPAGSVSVGPPIPRGGHVRDRCSAGTNGCGTVGTGRLKAGSPVLAAARRFAALPLAARRAWLVHHLTALRAGQITLEQLP